MKVLKKSMEVGGKVILNKQNICQSSKDACRDVGVGSLANECDIKPGGRGQRIKMMLNVCLHKKWPSGLPCNMKG